MEKMLTITSHLQGTLSMADSTVSGGEEGFTSTCANWETLGIPSVLRTKMLLEGFLLL